MLETDANQNIKVKYIRVGGGKATSTPTDDWWWGTERLVESSVRNTAGFINGYYAGKIKGRKLWLSPYGYSVVPKMINNVIVGWWFI